MDRGKESGYNMPTCQHANMPTCQHAKRAKSGRAGAAAHAKTLTVAQRSEITKKAADSRWS